MRFIDKQTGNTLETNNLFNIEQYKKHSDRYEAVTGTESKFDSMDDEEIEKYAIENDTDISKAKTRAAKIKILESSK